jgi:hypothetical protein
LTYNDLEQLRSKKLSNSTSSSASNQQASSNNNKRYLILTYNVEFDRINYPLQLNYQGKADVDILLNTIKNLRSQVKSYEIRLAGCGGGGGLNSRKSTTNNNKEDVDSELDEASRTESDYSRKKEVAAGLSETKLLKQIIKTIEEKSLKEKNLLQKQLIKRKQEIDLLKQQLSEVKLSERNLKNELRMMSNEVRMLKRPGNSSSKRSSSCESLHRMVVANDSYTRRQPTLPVSRSSSRNSSLTRNLPSPANSLSSINSGGASGAGRFNPTEYVRNRKLKLKETDLRRRRSQQRLGAGTGGSRERVSSASAMDSESEAYSYVSVDNEITNRSRRKPAIPAVNKQTSAVRLPARSRSKDVQRACNAESDLFSTTDEMKQIDAKLKSLQMLIKNNSNF